MLFTTYRVVFFDLIVNTFIGILDHEKQVRQPLHIDAKFDIEKTCEIIDINIKTVLDYRNLHSIIVDECNKTHINLIETLIENIAKRLLEEFSEIRALFLRIKKPLAFSNCSAVAIELKYTR